MLPPAGTIASTATTKGPAMSVVPWLDVQPSTKSDLPTIAQTMFVLMMRNVVTGGIVYQDPDPANNQATAAPGCILASPSYPTDFSSLPLAPPGNWTPSGRQNYVHNWTRDAAIVAMEMCAPGARITPEELALRMSDYVSFAAICRHNAIPGHFDRACSTVDGHPRDPWSDQSDGPALQTLAILGYYDRLPTAVRATAKSVVEANVGFLLAPRDGAGIPIYQDKTTSPWEEESGYSFFARSVQLRCLQELHAHPFDITLPDGVDAAITWLTDQLPKHWSDPAGCYTTFQPPWGPDPRRDPYDPNIDIVLGALLGAGTPVTEPKLLATAAKLRSAWTEDANVSYPINLADDHDRGIGPLLGRYPGDKYDGDVNEPDPATGHPWALCTCAMAELYYSVADAIGPGGQPPNDPLAEPFLDQAHKADPTLDTVTALRAAGDRMLEAVIFHSDNLELSEQFDRQSGFQKSVSNLTWSYAAFLSAVRAR
jgi:glucoamylase